MLRAATILSVAPLVPLLRAADRAPLSLSQVDIPEITTEAAIAASSLRALALSIETASKRSRADRVLEQNGGTYAHTGGNQSSGRRLAREMDPYALAS